MENFVYDINLNFKVTEFSFSTVVNGDFIERHAKGNVLSGEMKKIVSNAEKEQRVYIENIKAIGLDGSILQLGLISLIISE